MISKFFIYRPVFASVIAIITIILGLVAMLTLPIARYPDISPPTINVTAQYPGADAETVAETVATPLEEQINGVEGMSYMTSTSAADGSVTITVTFDVGTDLDMANVLVQNRVAVAEPTLPEEVQRLGVTITKQSPEVTLFISLYSDDNSYDALFLNNYAAIQLQDSLARVNGVGNVQIFGVGNYSMRVWLEPAALESRGLTTNDVVNAIREQNVQVAAGQIGAPPGPDDVAMQLTVNTQGRLTTVEEFSKIVVRSGEQGQLTLLRDVAKVELGSQTYTMNAQYNGAPCAVLAVYQLPGSNAIAVAEGIRKEMNNLERSFPEGLKYIVAYDATDVIRASMKEVVFTLFMTLGLVVLTVFIFLQNLRTTLIPTLTIPVSLIGTFAAMALLGFSINQLSLFGLVLVIGIVVDDAIVVVENTTRIMEEEPDLSARDASVKSMMQVTGPIVATTLVLLSVFIPTAFVSGISGELFRQFSLTIAVATFLSSINALTLSPALCALLLRRNTGEQFRLYRWINGGLDGTRSFFNHMISVSLRFTVIAVILFAGLIATAFFGLSQIPTGFVPQEDEGWAITNIQLPDAASLNRTQKVVDGVYDVIHKNPNVEHVIAITGYSMFASASGSNQATVISVLNNWDERKKASQSLNAIVQNFNQQFYMLQDAVVMTFEPPSLPGIGVAGGFSFELEDRGGVGLEMLQAMADEFVQDGNSQSALRNVFSTFRASVPQLYLDIDREQVKSMNIPLSDVFSTLQAYLGSTYVNEFNLFNRIFQVYVQAEGDARANPNSILDLKVRNANGEMVPLGTVLSIDYTVGPQIVNHFNIYPSATISGTTAPGFSSGQAMALMEQMADAKLPNSMGYSWSGLSYQEQQNTGGEMMIYLFSVILVYLVLAAQYESWTLPLSVCLAVPTALLGAVAGLMLRDIDNNVYTQIGIVLLIGLAAKNAILIVEFAKQEHEAGKSLREAAMNAAHLRFRAVLMTAFAFILGVVPLVIASGAGAQSRQSLGTTVFGGMLVSTVICLVAVPVMFYVIQSVSGWCYHKTFGSSKNA